MKLEEIAKIRTGLILSRKKSTNKVGHQYRVFTLASFEKDGTIQDDQIEKFESISEIERSLITTEGDILIRLSSPYTATYIEKQYQNILIPSLMAVIRVKSEKFLPEYVKVYLNSDKAKDEIRKEANGTVITTVSTKSLKELNIPEIPMQKQQDLINITKKYIEEKKLMNKLLQLKEEEYRYILNKNI